MTSSVCGDKGIRQCIRVAKCDDFGDCPMEGLPSGLYVLRLDGIANAVEQHCCSLWARFLSNIRPESSRTRGKDGSTLVDRRPIQHTCSTSRSEAREWDDVTRRSRDLLSVVDASQVGLGRPPETLCTGRPRHNRDGVSQGFSQVLESKGGPSACPTLQKNRQCKPVKEV